MPQIRLDLREADGHLPPVCLICGEQATIVKTKKMLWWPRWTYLFFFVHPFLWCILALIVSKRAQLQAPFCDEHQGHWFNRSLLIWGVGAFLVTITAAAFVATSVLFAAHELAALLAYVLGVGALLLWIIVIVIVQSTTIRPGLITKTEIILKGVSEAFVEAVQDADRKRLEFVDRDWDGMQTERESGQSSSVAIQEPNPSRRSEQGFDESRPRSSPPSDAIEE